MRQDEADDGTRADRLAAAERIAYVTIAHTTPAGAVSDHWAHRHGSHNAGLGCQFRTPTPHQGFGGLRRIP